MKFEGNIKLEINTPEVIKTETGRESKTIAEIQELGKMLVSACIAKMKFEGISKEDGVKILVYTFGGLASACQKSMAIKEKK